MERACRGIPVRKSSTPTAPSQACLPRGSTHVGAGSREVIWLKDCHKGCCQAGQFESGWLFGGTTRKGLKLVESRIPFQGGT